jgi:uncharacterized protein GlcG (DUF336 family)
MKASMIAGALTALLTLPASAQEGTHTVRVLTPETALAAAVAAQKKCRESGWQVAVAVVDRGGVAQVMLRDRFAGAHTPRTATGKAWTAVSFRTSTGELAKMTQPGQPQSGARAIRGAVMLGGGLLIESQGSILGAIGVSGAPGGEADEACARAGIDAIRERIEF